MERTLAPDTLGQALPAATAKVESLGHGDRILEERTLEVPPRALKQLRQALAGARGELTALAAAARSDDGVRVDGIAVDHIAGRIDPGMLIAAARRSGAAGPFGSGFSAATLKRSLVRAEFDLYADRTDGVLKRLDLTLSLDADPDNASPPTRIRFSLTGESPGSPE